jgi:hypothetical protein
MTAYNTFNTSMEVYSIASGAGDLEVKINAQTKKNLVFRPLVPVIVQHENLLPGTQYRMMLFPSTGEVTSQIVTTRCYCEIIGSDVTGVPTNAYSRQVNGYVTFVFTDNSRYVYDLFSLYINKVFYLMELLTCWYFMLTPCRCEEAYSFGRSQENSTNLNNAVVFTPDYYYMSPKECRSQFSVGLQAADDLRRSQLIVGQNYYYSIRASSRFSYRNSNPAIVEHKVRWQASIDGKVALSEVSGGLPISDVLVEYRLKSLNGTTISFCPPGSSVNSDWW